ncbi:serine hydrolase domain-containing protein [Sabulibacter ruber]|uniref:serine hydrolase domain-containing protein n=1 Tax=Sabulibacter ruber TaxID=2811901 RepID=UPI001A96F3BF|nr:serine hydrolase domain-containing protein [Sabulibacter ruber]
MRIATFLTVLLFSLTTLASAQSLSPDLQTKIDSVFRNWNHPNTPGAVLGIIHKGQLVYQKTYGMANIQKKEPLNGSHQFWIASMAKQFTAASVALLEEQGKLRLEDDIRKYMPELPVFKDTIRIKHLIYHTSGLRDGFTLIGLSFKGEKHYTNAEVMAKLMKQTDLNFTPGTRHEYNNGGYVVLAELVKGVSGKSLAEFARENIFDPLGMSNTHFYGTISADIPRLAQGYAVTYKKGKTIYKPTHFKANTVGSSGLVSTLEDLAKWDQNFYNNQLGKKNQALIEQITARGTLTNGTRIPYGFGLEIENYRGTKVITHSGSDPGFIAEMVRFPEYQLTLICLANTTNLYQLTPQLVRMGSWLLPLQEQEQTPEIANHPGEQISLKQLTGIYLNKENLAEARFVTLQENKLFAASSINGYRVPLKQVQPNRFVNEGLQSQAYSFQANSSPNSMKLEYQAWTSGATMKKVDSAVYAPDDLKTFEGTFYSPELGKTYRITVKKGKLGLSLFRIIHVPFLPVSGNKFLADFQGNNCLEFQKNSSGAVTGFTFSRESVTKLRFVKR